MAAAAAAAPPPRQPLEPTPNSSSVADAGGSLETSLQSVSALAEALLLSSHHEGRCRLGAMLPARAPLGSILMCRGRVRLDKIRRTSRSPAVASQSGSGALLLRRSLGPRSHARWAGRLPGVARGGVGMTCGLEAPSNPTSPKGAAKPTHSSLGPIASPLPPVGTLFPLHRARRSSQYHNMYSHTDSHAMSPGPHAAAHLAYAKWRAPLSHGPHWHTRDSDEAPTSYDVPSHVVEGTARVRLRGSARAHDTRALCAYDS